MSDFNNKDTEKTEQGLYNLLKFAGKKAGILLFKAIGIKGIAIIILILLILSVIMIFMGSIYSALPQTKGFTSIKYNERQSELEKRFKEIADKSNIYDRWLIKDSSLRGNFDKFNFFDVVLKELQKNHPYDDFYFKDYYTKEELRKIMKDAVKEGIISGLKYNDKTKRYEYSVGKYDAESYFETSEELRDYYGNDLKHFNTFGIIYMAGQAVMLNYYYDNIDESFSELHGIQLRPLLHYKSSTITTCCPCGEDGEETCCTTQNIYLLTDAYTIKGHYKYDYEWVTEQAGKCTITYEKLVGETLIGEEYERLDYWISSVLNNRQEDFEMTRTLMLESADATTAQREWLEWVFKGARMKHAITQGIVNPLYLSYFKEAEEIFGIPAWFLMAIAFNESSLLANAENEKTKAYGLMQLMPAEQKGLVDRLVKEYPHLLGDTFLEQYKNSEKTEAFYRSAISDPRINIFAGTLCLLEKGLNPEKINWKGNWQEQVLPFLAAYGGYSEVPQNLWNKYGITNREEAKQKENVLKWAKDEYASKIFKLAETMQVEKVKPFQGNYPITSRFGNRTNPTNPASGSEFHTGVDFGLPKGTPLYAVTNGIVVEAGTRGGYGNTVVISNGIYSFRYAHMDMISVSKGQKIFAGDYIGNSGNTGRSTGPHLHFEIKDNYSGNFIDPLSWLGFF